MITTRKLKRAMFASLPAWLAVVVMACMAIPGWFDDIVAAVPVVILLVVQPVRVRRFASAWRGGKSHRMADMP